MLNFSFLEKGLGIVSPPHFVYDFSRKMVLNASLPDCLYFLKYWSMCVLQYCVFLIKPFSYITKKSRQKFKYLEKKRAFNVK